GSRAAGDSDGRRQDRERRAQGVEMIGAVVLALTLAGPEPDSEKDEQQSAWEAAGWGAAAAEPATEVAAGAEPAAAAQPAPEAEAGPGDTTAPVEIVPPTEPAAPIEAAPTEQPLEQPDTAASAWDQPSTATPEKDKRKVGDVLM